MHYGFLFIPARLAFASCLVYLILVAGGWGIIAATLRTAGGIGIWGVSGTPRMWITLNTLLFFAATLIAWRIVVPKVVQ